jgi:hypothetical protein
MRAPILVAALLAGALSLGFAGKSAESITWTVTPLVVRWDELVAASGTVGSGANDQLVTIQMRTCDEDVWRDVAEAHTTAGGRWSVDFLTRISGAIRASSAGAASESLSLRQRPWVFFSQRPPGRFRAGVQAQRQFWRRKMRIERFDKSRNAWVLVKRVLITETVGDPTAGGMSDITSTTERFRLDVRKGTTLRAVLPLNQARPCYLAGYSALLRR